MGRIFNWRVGSAILIVAVYFLIYCTMRHNLSAVTAAISDERTTIIIDAGHGGEDGGAIGIGGASESQINLAISQRLEQLLVFMGHQTSMIRSEDVSVHTGGTSITERKVSDLKNRVSIVNQIPSAVLISIHQNHFSEKQYSGAQVFYASTEGSRRLAEMTQEQLRECLNPNNNRTCKQAESVYLMNEIKCPGILVECGFLSNEKEEQQLLQPEYQKKIICAIGCALGQYLSEGDHHIEV